MSMRSFASPEERLRSGWQPYIWRQTHRYRVFPDKSGAALL